MLIYKAENLCRNFKSGFETVQAVKNVNLSINQGELVILRGRSGSGKTSLINILGTLDKASSGKLYFEDHDIGAMDERSLTNLRRKKISFIFQPFALMSLMTAYENVEFPLRLLGMPTKEREKRVKECLSLVGLTKRMNHRPAELSGGEQQRVAVARAMAPQPNVILADEPMAELDSHMALQIMRIFCDIVSKEGVTIVMTTHDPNIMELGDIVYTIEDGVLRSGYQEAENDKV
jgi:putative ABC transport system ATP-binding protein